MFCSAAAAFILCSLSVFELFKPDACATASELTLLLLITAISECIKVLHKIKPPNDLSFLNDYLNCICISNIFLKHYKQDYTPH